MSPMKSIVSAVAFLLVVIWTADHSARAQSSWGPPNPQIDIAYAEPKNPGFRPLYDKLKKREVLEILRAFLAPLRLPRTIAVKIDECGSAGVHYKPGAPVTICYEYIAILERAAPDVRLQIGGQVFTRDDALVGAFVHVTLHEMARAVFDVLEIPVWGREDHAADRVAGFLMFQFGEKVAYRTLVGTSWFLSQVSASRTGLPSGDFAYTRSLDGETLQRFYNVLCVAYGGDPDNFAFVKRTLPDRRSENCRSEYLQLQRSFNDTFMPYIDPDLLKKVQATDWFKLPDAK
jgi:Putative metallopeptidase